MAAAPRHSPTPTPSARSKLPVRGRAVPAVPLPPPPPLPPMLAMDDDVFPRPPFGSGGGMAAAPTARQSWLNMQLPVHTACKLLLLVEGGGASGGGCASRDGCSGRCFRSGNCCTGACLGNMFVTYYCRRVCKKRTGRDLWLERSGEKRKTGCEVGRFGLCVCPGQRTNAPIGTGKKGPQKGDYHGDPPTNLNLSYQAEGQA